MSGTKDNGLAKNLMSSFHNTIIDVQMLVKIMFPKIFKYLILSRLITSMKFDFHIMSLTLYHGSS